MDELLAFCTAHKSALMWVSIASVAMFVGSLLLMPLLIARAPEDYFTREKDPNRESTHIALKVLLNLLGVVLMLAGLAMLVLPGQGLLMMLLSLTLLDIPGKHKLVQRIAKKPPVWRALSYFRERAHKPPFLRPE
jgi:archaellum biogenesis protein FlaJ (TadC family)